uniref:small ribosomal subunit protein mS25 n=1 Tax=Myxine glutinosa TaxID=7769 RepID=UPI00358DDE5F
MLMKGRYPVTRTLQYLREGDVVLKTMVKVMTVNYQNRSEASAGARNYITFKVPQIQYKNPRVQIVMFRNITPSPFLCFYLDNGEQIMLDVEGKTFMEIHERVQALVGRSQEDIQASETKQEMNTANFGPRVHNCLRRCICEVPGQVPCPSLVELPKATRGKYSGKIHREAEDAV